MGDDGQPIREISSVMMTTSGYLSSSREGKLPETKIRKICPETELENLPTEKKINMKKLFEGIKKADENSRKCDEKDSDLVKKLNEIIKDREVENEEGKKLQLEPTKEADVEKEGKRERNKDKERVKEQEKEREREVEKEREKEKEKAEKDKIIAKEQEKEKMKKKRKEKLLEEFAFFEKEKSTSFKPSESITPVDSTKQKLNIFKKLSKTKDIDNQASRVAVPPPHRVPPETNESEKGSNASFDEVAFKGFSDIASLSSNSEVFPIEKTKVSKKERKLKNKKDRHGFASEIGIVDGQSKGRPGADFFKGDPASSKEESSFQSDSTSGGKSSQNQAKMVTDHGVDLPKRKRGRPSRMMTPEISESQISEVVPPPVHAESPIPSIPKSFFPFSPHFPVPGLVSQPFIQNVPFNLLGVPPLGLRSPLGISPSNMLASLGAIPTNVSPSDFSTTPKGDSTNKIPPSPSPATKSPNIVDSLPESSLHIDTCESDATLSKKKEKRDKKEKEKKKKEKKIKVKVSDEQERKTKREKKKEKKDKDKDKEKDKCKEKEEITVPKITFKFAAAPTSPNPPTPDSTPKL